jgi:copper chaperone
MKTTRTVFDVTGMSCPSCIRHIDEALRDLDGVTKVEVRLHDGRVAVDHEPGTPATSALITALQDAGYEATVSGAR